MRNADKLIVKNPAGFANGYTAVTSMAATDDKTGLDFGILKISAGESYDLSSPLETACLLLTGDVTFTYAEGQRRAARNCIFDEDPVAIHFCKDRSVTLTAVTDSELNIVRAVNNAEFETVVFDSTNMLESERRGKGQLEDTSYRIVRTIFDIRNRPEAKLVLGEVITFPGRWSSYPPHHHPQPEIYHYRFTEPQGYGYCQLGEDIKKVGMYDTSLILDEDDHSQVAAPGYGMYYIWAIRHLDGNPYTVPEFTEEHKWTCGPEANERVWKPGFEL
ncbi:5-deoxy-glucuronate isomerase [Lentisphaerota bacterium ZTH]|nr:5-deoxy-glucuronate isomerase [Lentisphaerota bacterium]WET07535.1 5-deoxy-glucuronate isomerase [Lentisphaerota bacterium ZTH]